MTRTLLSSVFVLLALAAPRYSCPQARPSETSVEKKMDALFSGATSPDAPGLAVLVRQDGKAIFEHELVADLGPIPVIGFPSVRLVGFTELLHRLCERGFHLGKSAGDKR